MVENGFLIRISVGVDIIPREMYTGPTMRILFLGHSLVEYFDWQGRFPGHEVFNLGVAGETTGELLERSDRVVRGRERIDAVLVMTGTNDLLSGDRSFLEDYRELTLKLRGLCRDSRIVLHSILPVDPEWVARPAIDELNIEIAKIADEAGAEFFDLTKPFTAANGEARPELLLEDGVHLSPAGYRVWSGELEKLLGL
jgi:lysophospholipase L1-like esterase